MTSNAVITPTSAIAIANAVVIEAGYTANSRAAEGDLIELRLARMVGDVERVQTVKISRSMRVYEFQEVCRRAWLFLRLEHERK